MNQVIPYQTAAYTTEGKNDIEVTKDMIPCSFIIDLDSDLTYDAGDTIAAHYVGHDGTRDTPVVDADGNAVTLSTSNKHLPIHSPCKLRFVKGVTTEAVGLNWHR